MPFIPVPHINHDISLALWRVEEEEEYFLERLSIYENEKRIIDSISHPRKRLEWLSSRLCLKELLRINHPVESLNEVTGKPYLSDHSFHISYSHTNLVSGAIASSKGAVSMDLEDYKRQRNLETRFLFMHPDELRFFEETGDLRAFFLTWSAKETLYKMHAKKGLVFKENLIINPERKPIEQKGVLTGIIKENGDTKTYPVFYCFFPDVLLTYTFDSNPLW